MHVPLVEYGSHEETIRVFHGRSAPADSDDLRGELKPPICFYCQATMQAVPSYSSRSHDDCDETSELTLKRLLECTYCGWWAFHAFGDLKAWGGDGAQASYSITEKLVCATVKEYDIAQETIPINMVRQWLAKHPHDIAHINPHAFERLMAECFKDVYSDAEVVHVGKHSSDGGVDIKLVMSSGTTVLVQVKRRHDLTKAEGIEAVRSLNGVLLREGLTRGIVVTTAKSFTQPARNEARPSAPPFDRFTVDLVALNDVVNMLNIRRESEGHMWQRALNKFDVRCSHTYHDPRSWKTPDDDGMGALRSALMRDW